MNIAFKYFVLGSGWLLFPSDGLNESLRILKSTSRKAVNVELPCGIPPEHHRAFILRRSRCFGLRFDRNGDGLRERHENMGANVSICKKKIYKTSSFPKRQFMAFPTLLQDVCKTLTGKPRFDFHWWNWVRRKGLWWRANADRCYSAICPVMSLASPPPIPLSFYSVLSPPALQIQLTAWPSAVSGC